jgi:hypothetical protein
MATVISKEQWFPTHFAVALIRQHRPNISVGRAEKLVHDAAASGEVRSVDKVVQDFSVRPGRPYKKITLSNKDDLIDWLDRHVPQDKPAVTKNRRLLEDDELVAEAVKGIRDSPRRFANAHKAALALAARAEGISEKAIVDRLGRKIREALRD